MTKTKKPVGRPRKYKNKAAKQKVYRSREKERFENKIKELENRIEKLEQLSEDNISSGFSLNPEDLVL